MLRKVAVPLAAASLIASLAACGDAPSSHGTMTASTPAMRASMQPLPKPARLAAHASVHLHLKPPAAALRTTEARQTAKPRTAEPIAPHTIERSPARAGSLATRILRGAFAFTLPLPKHPLESHPNHPLRTPAARAVPPRRPSAVRTTVVVQSLHPALPRTKSPQSGHPVVTAALLACVGALPDTLCGHPQAVPAAPFARLGADGTAAAIRIDNVLAFTSTRHHDELMACVSFTNEAPVGATGVRFHFDAKNAAGATVKSFTQDISGEFAPGVSIQAPTFPSDSLVRALKYCWWTKRPDEAFNNTTRVNAYVDHVTFSDGVLWDTHGMPLP